MLLFHVFTLAQHLWIDNYNFQINSLWYDGTLDSFKYKDLGLFIIIYFNMIQFYVLPAEVGRMGGVAGLVQVIWFIDLSTRCC